MIIIDYTSYDMYWKKNKQTNKHNSSDVATWGPYSSFRHIQWSYGLARWISICSPWLLLVSYTSPNNSRIILYMLYESSFTSYWYHDIMFYNESYSHVHQVGFKLNPYVNLWGLALQEHVADLAAGPGRRGAQRGCLKEHVDNFVAKNTLCKIYFNG